MPEVVHDLRLIASLAAVAGKLSALRAADYFCERAGRADSDEGWTILEQAGDPDLPLQNGDELEEPATGWDRGVSIGTDGPRGSESW
jgi:hypothetical protein